MSAEHPETGREWFALGLENMGLGFHREAIEAWQHAIALDGPQMATTYNCAYSSAAQQNLDGLLYWAGQALPFLPRGSDRHIQLLETCFYAASGQWTALDLPASLDDL